MASVFAGQDTSTHAKLEKTAKCPPLIPEGNRSTDHPAHEHSRHEDTGHGRGYRGDH